LKYFKNLIYFWVANKQRSSLIQLVKNASNCPGVYSKRVLSLTKKNLRCSVPKSFDFMSQSSDWNWESSC
jgi:hypothetical protein